MTNDEKEIRASMERWVRALHEGNLEAMMAEYASDVVLFDLHPPSTASGSDAVRAQWAEALPFMKETTVCELRDVHVVAGADVAVAYAFNHMKSTRNSRVSERKVRVTLGFRKIDGKWLVVHEHASFPVDMEKGTALFLDESTR